jgi:hypothetical protein
LATLIFISLESLPRADRKEPCLPKVDYSRVTVRLGEAEANKLAELARHTDRPVPNLLRLLIKQATTLSSLAPCLPHTSLAIIVTGEAATGAACHP